MPEKISSGYFRGKKQLLKKWKYLFLCGGVIYQRSMFCIGFPYSMVDWEIMESLRCGFGRSSRHSGYSVNGDSEVLFSSVFVSGSWAILSHIITMRLSSGSAQSSSSLSFHAPPWLSSSSSFNASNAQEAAPFFNGRKYYEYSCLHWWCLLIAFS